MIDGDYIEYLKNLKYSNVFGTKTELLALSLYYEQNLMVFEPFNVGQHLINNPSFNDCLMVFSIPTTAHFDILCKVADDLNGNFL